MSDSDNKPPVNPADVLIEQMAASSGESYETVSHVFAAGGGRVAMAVLATVPGLPQARLTSDEGVPARLSVAKDSPFYDAEAILKVDVYFNGVMRRGDVVEYCIPDAWLRVQIKDLKGRVRRERGKILVRQMQGRVVVKWKKL